LGVALASAAAFRFFLVLSLLKFLALRARARDWAKNGG